MSVSGACAPGPSKTISVRPSPLPLPAVTAPTFRLVLLLGVLVALGPFTIDMYLPALPVIAPDLGSTPAAVQLTLTGTLVGVAVGQLVIGPLSDALGRRRPLVAGVAVHVVAPRSNGPVRLIIDLLELGSVVPLVGSVAEVPVAGRDAGT